MHITLAVFFLMRVNGGRSGKEMTNFRFFVIFRISDDAFGVLRGDAGGVMRCRLHAHCHDIQSCNVIIQYETSLR